MNEWMYHIAFCLSAWAIMLLQYIVVMWIYNQVFSFYFLMIYTACQNISLSWCTDFYWPWLIVSKQMSLLCSLFFIQSIIFNFTAYIILTFKLHLSIWMTFLRIHDTWMSTENNFLLLQKNMWTNQLFLWFFWQKYHLTYAVQLCYVISHILFFLL